MDARILLFSQNLHTLSGGARLGKDRQKRQRERAPRAGPKTVPHLGHGMGQGLDVSLPQCLTSMEKDRWGPSKMTSRMRQLVVSKGFFIKRLFIKQRHRTAACLKANARVIATYFSSSLQSTQVSFSKPLSTCLYTIHHCYKEFSTGYEQSQWIWKAAIWKVLWAEVRTSSSDMERGCDASRAAYSNTSLHRLTRLLLQEPNGPASEWLYAAFFSLHPLFIKWHHWTKRFGVNSPSFFVAGLDPSDVFLHGYQPRGDRTWLHIVFNAQKMLLLILKYCIY